MKKKKYVLAVIKTVAIALLIYYFFHPLVYQTNYYFKLGIGQSHIYDSIVKRKGEPLSVRQSDDKGWVVYYDGLEIIYGTNIETGMFRCVTITGSKYRFGIWRIGIGTSRKKLESVYRHVRKLKDLPSGSFGVIDGGTWVRFSFDENNNVSQIDITDGI